MRRFRQAKNNFNGVIITQYVLNLALPSRRPYRCTVSGQIAREIQSESRTKKMIRVSNMQSASEECPLFTTRHAHHSALWTIPGFSMPKFCLACAVERLEDRAGVSLHHKRVLGELRALLAASNDALLHVLTSDERVLEHFLTTVFGKVDTTRQQVHVYTCS